MRIPLTLEERRLVAEGAKQLHFAIRYESRDHKRWVELAAMPDGVTWSVTVTRSDGVRQDGCVNGDGRLEGELVGMLEQVKAVAKAWEHGPS